MLSGSLLISTSTRVISSARLELVRKADTPGDGPAAYFGPLKYLAFSFFPRFKLLVH